MRKHLKFAFAFAAAVITAALCTLCAAAANNVSDIEINVLLNRDGSARVTQVWTGDFDEGTECYLPFMLGDHLTIGELSVSMNGREFICTDGWDLEASFNSKAYTCGLNPVDGGYEICWGISDYGDNTYEISYTVGGMLCSYEESDGFNFRFINSGMSTGPTDAELFISAADGTALTDSVANIWAFGYDGNIEFEDGGVHAYSRSALRSDNHMTVMLEVEKGVFSPSVTLATSFEKVKNTAFEGSDYDYGDGGISTAGLIILLLILILCISGVVALIIFFALRRRRNRRFMKDAGYYRDLPCGGDIYTVYRLCMLFDGCTDSRIIGAGILALAEKGCIVPCTQEEALSFGRTAETTVMKLNAAPDSDALLGELYGIIEKAAGDNAVLEEKELKNYAYKNPSSLRRFINDAQKAGNLVISKEGLFEGRIVPDVKKLTDTGKEKLRQAAGFKNYLLDFSLIAEREIKELSVWRGYLVFAQLFGIADRVAKQLKKLYPESLPEIESLERTVITADMWSRTMCASMYRREGEIQAKRSSGGGGFSSLGGGGGFSGGGFGGGTR